MSQVLWVVMAGARVILVKEGENRVRTLTYQAVPNVLTSNQPLSTEEQVFLTT